MKVRLYADKKGNKQSYIEITRDVAQFGKGIYWFNMTNENGATESHPYGYTTKERLENLYSELGELLKLSN